MRTKRLGAIAGTRAAKKAGRRIVAGAKADVRAKCRHCRTPNCTAHCPANKSGRHEVEFGDVHVVDSDPTVAVVEIFCQRCGDRANAVVVESSFTWEGRSRDDHSYRQTRTGR